MRITPARALALGSAFVALYSFARVMVLFFEALSLVRAERAEDAELLELCASGQARGSTKMRAACLKAHADLASPIVFKAIVQAVSTAFRDFGDSVSSPFKLGLVLLFFASSVLMPVSSWIRLLMGVTTGGVGDDDVVSTEGVHFISYAPPSSPRRGGVRHRFRRALRKLRVHRSGTTSDAYDSPTEGRDNVHISMPGDGGEGEDDLEPGHARRSTSPAVRRRSSASGQGMDTPWQDISIGGAGGGGSGVSKIHND